MLPIILDADGAAGSVTSCSKLVPTKLPLAIAPEMHHIGCWLDGILRRRCAIGGLFVSGLLVFSISLLVAALDSSLPVVVSSASAFADLLYYLEDDATVSSFLGSRSQ